MRSVKTRFGTFIVVPKPKSKPGTAPKPEKLTAAPEQQRDRATGPLYLSGAQNLWDKNPAFKKHLVSFCLNEASHERHFSFRRAVEEARARCKMNSEGEQFKINNNYIAPLARIIVQEYPEVRPYIEFRRARCDELFEREADRGEA